MAVKFNDSLIALVEVAQAYKVDLAAGITVVRDGRGRLMLASEQAITDRKIFEDALRERLGAYCAPLFVVEGSSAKTLSVDKAVRSITVQTASGSVKVRYADRRIVGSDWLAAPAQETLGPPRIVFASLKGGVGRSTALSVLAADLARAGKRVLAFDLDIEAPGIGFMLLPAGEDVADDKRPKYGVVDYLVENGLNGVKDDELSDFVGVAKFAEGFIHVVPAVGRITDENPASMLAKLSRAMVEDSGPLGRISVQAQIAEMVNRFSTFGEYDAVLIDARAGMAELSAAPLISLGAEVLLFGTDQQQTFRGYRYLLSHIAMSAISSQSDEWPSWRERISFVQSKAPSSSLKRSSFRNEIHILCSETLYDKETLDENGRVAIGSFNPGPDEEGPGIPHDAIFIENHPDYEAFDPGKDGTQLDLDVYNGPFGRFLLRAWYLLGLDRGVYYG